MIALSLETLGTPDGLFPLLNRVCCVCCEIEGISEAMSHVRIVDDLTMEDINRTFRGIDSTTDVLSFPSIPYLNGKTARDRQKRLLRERDPETGLPYLGDIAISLPRAKEQARDYGHPIERELGYLTAHALFHLMGYDHETEVDKARMRALEEQVMEKIGLSREDKEI